ncbi:proteolytically activated transcription factor, putative [Candida dubliniensis CD36]|uniref:Zinc finger protein, putative n=1 Tax=Candida dubliniensis (strain CD36 / ATCC MYA-646 / CBS 7987 / NCPF 3949 / NRRL Y-17841) TaxID=573826 RepID=B9WE50_CANDC|nr:proteolytically activated transcription factor, putative [Candida dubliniensis CD36]CAX42961.1 proteolytically activated transcription factor, putative [Candida dubliniensis CD36]
MLILSIGLINHTSNKSLYTISPNKGKRYEPFTTTSLDSFKFHVVRFLHRLIYGTQRYQELFPPIQKIKDINNVKQQRIFPVNCAADDLDLGFGESDQIELFNHSSKDAYGHHNLIQLIDFFDSPQAHSSSPADEFFKSNKISEQIDIFDMIGRQPPPLHHQQLNIETPYFEDFATPLVLPQHEVSSDDVESYFSRSVSTVSSIEPLDDEFVPPPHPPRAHPSRKRKHESISPPIPTSSSSSSTAQLIPSCSSSVASSSDLSVSPTTKRKYTKRRYTKKKQPVFPNQDEPIVITTTTKTNNIDVKKVTTTKNGTIENRFDCPSCDASFKVKGYLTRHLKKHSTNKAFECPFFDNHGVYGSKCHPTGGFSRRDTFKVHLRALHFIYPAGVKANQRSSFSGRCAGCFQFFDSNSEWLENHIEAGKCTGTVTYKQNVSNLLLD